MVALNVLHIHNCGSANRECVTELGIYMVTCAAFNRASLEGSDAKQDSVMESRLKLNLVNNFLNPFTSNHIYLSNIK